MGKGKIQAGSAAQGGSSPLDEVMRVDGQGRNVYFSSYLNRYYYVPESRVKQLSFFQNRTIFSISLAAIIGATTELWIGIALFCGLYALTSAYFYLSFVPGLKEAPAPELSENDRVLEEARHRRQNTRRLGYAVVVFVVAALLVYYSVTQSFAGANLWSARLMAAACVVFGIIQLALYGKRRA